MIVGIVYISDFQTFTAVELLNTRFYSEEPDVFGFIFL